MFVSFSKVRWSCKQKPKTPRLLFCTAVQSQKTTTFFPSFSQFKNALVPNDWMTWNFNSNWLKVSSSNISWKSLLWWDSCTSSRFTEVSHFQLESMTIEQVVNGSSHSCRLLCLLYLRYFRLLPLARVNWHSGGRRPNLLGSVVKYRFSSAGLCEPLDLVPRLRKGMPLCQSPQSCDRCVGGLKVVCVILEVKSNSMTHDWWSEVYTFIANCRKSWLISFARALESRYGMKTGSVSRPLS